MNMRRCREILRQKRGAVLVLMVAGIVMLMGFAAIVVDVGLMYVNRMQLLNLVDAAVLAGVQELPGEPDRAVAVAQSYAAQNGKQGDVVIVEVLDESGNVVVGTFNGESKDALTAYEPLLFLDCFAAVPSMVSNWLEPRAEAMVQVSSEANTLRVQARRTVTMFFARALGQNSVVVTGRAAAQVAPLSGAANVVPWGLEQQSLIYGVTYILKNGAALGNYQGNFGAVALGGNGANVYRDNIKFGYKGKLKVGDWIPTEPGNMSGPTSDGVAYRISLDPTATFQTVTKNSGRIVVVPVVESLDVHGRKDVLIVGFAAFFLEGVGGSGNDNYVTGKFMQFVTPGDYGGGAASFGVYSSRLIKYVTQ